MTTKIKGLINCLGSDHPDLHIERVTPVTHVSHQCQSVYMCSVLQDHTGITSIDGMCTVVLRVHAMCTVVLRVHAMCTSIV